MSGSLDAHDGLWAAIGEVARKGALGLIGYVAVVTAMYSVSDIVVGEDNGIYLVASIVGWALGYLLLVHLMRVSAFYGEQMPGGIGTYFGIGLVSGLGIFIGLVVFVLPGLYLLMRWTPAYARAYGSSDGLEAAMRWSWNGTKPIQMPLALAILPAVLPLAVLFFFAIAYSASTGDATWLDGIEGIVIFNLLLSVSAAWLQLVGVAAYRMIAREPEGLIETFS